MDEYKDIETAARHRDWQGCARIMFSRLFRCPADEQRNVAAKALHTYIKVWKAKHKSALRSVPDRVLTNKNNGTRPPLPDFPEDLDPADSEFENGLLAFYNGAYFPGPDSRRT